MKNPLVSLGIVGEKTPTPHLLTTEIKYQRSVIHAALQASARSINDVFGVENDALLDEFLATQGGKDWLRGFKDYAAFVLAKSL